MENTARYRNRDKIPKGCNGWWSVAEQAILHDHRTCDLHDRELPPGCTGTLTFSDRGNYVGTIHDRLCPVHDDPIATALDAEAQRLGLTNG